jgi:hypothetical protein
MVNIPFVKGPDARAAGPPGARRGVITLKGASSATAVVGKSYATRRKSGRRSRDLQAASASRVLRPSGWRAQVPGAQKLAASPKDAPPPRSSRGGRAGAGPDRRLQQQLAQGAARREQLADALGGDPAQTDRVKARPRSSMADAPQLASRSAHALGHAGRCTQRSNRRAGHQARREGALAGPRAAAQARRPGRARRAG